MDPFINFVTTVCIGFTVLLFMHHISDLFEQEKMRSCYGVKITKRVFHNLKASQLLAT